MKLPHFLRMGAAMGALMLSLQTMGAKAHKPVQGYPFEPVAFTQVHIDGGFWLPRMEASRKVTIPLAFSKCEENERYANFYRAAHPSEEYKVEGFPFDDTDVYKTIEGASYCLSIKPDKRLEAYIDSIITVMAAAQEPDGYLYTARTQNPAHPHDWSGKKRWEKVEDLSHEFYNLGHMVEGAVAHYQATGKRNFLDIAIRYADCVIRNIGDGQGQLRLVPGHQIAEMALVRLYNATGESRYLDQAKFFLDARGTTAHRNAYSQSHVPPVEQSEAVGHAVRATYMYAGMADVAAITGDTAYVAAIDRIWDNIVNKKLYITGGIGARHQGESFGDNYELPNASAYNETCAAIGNVYTNYRLFLLHGNSKYYDVLERTLYNGLISGVSIDGGTFFYPNPLASDGGYSRKPWFGCACCPSNISRFMPSLSGYIYATRGNDLYVNLFASSKADLKVGGKHLIVKQETDYPWSGDVAITIEKGSADAALNVRIPGWVRNQPVPGTLYSYTDSIQPTYTVKVNGEKVEGDLQNGYMRIDRRWKKGDRVDVSFDMPVRLVRANEKVKADRGLLAVECGPIVYCAEWPDNEHSVASTLLNRRPKFTTEFRPGLLGGVRTVSTQAQSLAYDADGNLTATPTTLRLIPYYAWAHRGEGPMRVWLPYYLSAPDLVPENSATGSTSATKRGSNGFFDGL